MSAYMRSFLHLRFDESQKVLLIHAARMMNVRVHFTGIIEVTACPRETSAQTRRTMESEYVPMRDVLHSTTVGATYQAATQLRDLLWLGTHFHVREFLIFI